MSWLVRDGKVLATLEVAESRSERRRGLLGRDTFDGVLMMRTRSIHTIGMKFPIDAAICDSGEVYSWVCPAPDTEASGHCCSSARVLLPARWHCPGAVFRVWHSGACREDAGLQVHWHRDRRAVLRNRRQQMPTASPGPEIMKYIATVEKDDMEIVCCIPDLNPTSNGRGYGTARQLRSGWRSCG